MGGAGILLKRGLLAILVLGMVTAGCSGGGAALQQDKAESLAKLQKVDVKESGDYTTVVVLFDQPVTYNSVRLSDPPKLVLDLAGVDVGGHEGRIQVDKSPVTYIMPSKVANTKRLARLEVGLDRVVDYKVAQDGATLSIVFENTAEAAKPEAGAVAAEPVAEKAEALDEAENAQPVEENTAAQAEAAQNAAPETAKPQPQNAVTHTQDANAFPVEKVQPNLPDATRVEKISCTRNGEVSQVSISGNGRFKSPKVFMLGKDRLVVDLPDVGSLKDKDSFKVDSNCIKGVRMARHADPRKVRIVLDLARPVDYEIQDDGKVMVLSLAPAGNKAALKALLEKKSEKAVQEAKVDTKMGAGRNVEVRAGSLPGIPKPAEGIKVYISKEDGKAVLSTAPMDESGMSKVEDKTKDYVETATKIYTGGRISFDIQDADLDTVIKLLADVAGLNLIVDPSDVKGKVTLKLDNVPWDQALDVLLKIYRLDKVIEGNVLRVAPKAKLDDERKRELQQIAEQKKLEQEAEDLYTKTFKLSYATATDLEGKIKKILSKRGDATPNPRTNELIVTDIKDNIEKAEKLIVILDKGVNQILIEARIVTVSLGYSQNFGVSWGLRRNTGPDGPNPQFGVSQGPTSSLLVGADGQNGSHSYLLNLPEELIAGAGGIVGAMSWGSLLKNINLDLTIQALEIIDKAETLAAPKVLTLENQEAQISQGLKIYVQTTSASGTKPEPLDSNLSLTVTPRVVGENLIMMDVNATKNTPETPPTGAVASINTNAVTTKVMVRDGETIVLGGVYTRSDEKIDSQIPYLGRIPILGWLFRTRVIERPTDELLIFITPRLVKPANTQI